MSQISRIAHGGMMVAAALVLAAGAANAGSKRTYQDRRADSDRPPIKDCTKLNGRFGYYGNPYCTPEEQARFDRWQAQSR